MQQPETSRRAPATILVVDDEPENVQLMVEVLERAGYATLSATSGPEAVDLAAQRRPDGILLDLLMPGMDGFEVLRQLHGRPETAEIPVMVITAMVVAGPQREFLSHHARSVLQKGAFWIEDLLQEVARMLSRGAGAATK